MEPELIKHLKLCFNMKPKEAIDYLKSKKIKVSWDWESRLDIIKSHGFTVANVATADMLQIVYDEVVKAIEEGTPIKEFKENIQTRFAESGMLNTLGTGSRLTTIYRTNMQNAFMAGRYLQIMSVSEYFPYGEYLATLDIRTRPNHAALHGKVVPLDDAFWDTHTPTNGHNCRCRFRAIDKDEVEKRGLKISKGDDLKKFEPDEGFDHKPTESYKPDFNKFAPSIRTALKEALG